MFSELSVRAYKVLAQSPLGDAGDLGIPDTRANQSVINTVFDVLLLIAGALSVIFIIIGGIILMTGGGNPEQVKRGRTTIMYAVLGLIITILAFAIVNLVINVAETGNVVEG